jgi:hypothetical protein
MIKPSRRGEMVQFNPEVGQKTRGATYQAHGWGWWQCQTPLRKRIVVGPLLAVFAVLCSETSAKGKIVN